MNWRTDNKKLPRALRSAAYRSVSCIVAAAVVCLSATISPTAPAAKPHVHLTAARAHAASRCRAASRLRRSRHHHRRQRHRRCTRSGRAFGPKHTSTKPTAPSNVSARAGDSSVALAWAASTDRSSSIAGYRVYRNNALLTQVSTTGYTDGGLSDGTAYSYYIVAVDAAGNTSSPSTTVSATPVDTTPPNSPSGLAASSISSSGATLSWTPSSDNVGVAGYTVYVNGTSVGTTTQSTYTFGALACGTSSTLGVSAFDAAGNVSALASTSVVTSACSTTTPPAISPNSYFISPAGSDTNPCSEAAPCRTISHASALLRPGYTLYARGGTYTGQYGVSWAGPSGTATAPVTFTNYPGEKPIFDGQNTANSFLDVVGKSYLTINGMTIQNYKGCCAAIWIGYDGGSDTNYSTYDTISNNTIQNIGSKTDQYGGTNTHGIYISYGVFNIVVSGNTIVGVSGAGIHRYHDLPSGGPGAGNIVIYNNVIDQQNYGVWGIVLRNASGAAVYNNTIVNAMPFNSAGGADIDYGGSTSVTIRDNIVSLPFEGSGATCDHNMFVNNANGGATTPNCGSSNVATASGGFANPWPAGEDYHLSASSKAISAGVSVPSVTVDKDGLARPQGGGWDIGAYEYPG